MLLTTCRLLLVAGVVTSYELTSGWDFDDTQITSQKMKHKFVFMEQAIERGKRPVLYSFTPCLKQVALLSPRDRAMLRVCQ